jgi:hypothetical protein
VAVVQDLHDVAQILSELVTNELGYADVQAGPPRNAGATTTPAIRFTLLYMTPQGTHRNDPWVRNADGTQRAPPLTLSCFYLVTASGADADDPIAAHNALGRVMQLFHDRQQLRLPLSEGGGGSPPGSYTELGEGELAVIQVPLTIEQIDKVWSSLEEHLQPWALFEVSPVQLPALRPDAPPPALVRPGGVQLGAVRAGRRPSIERIAPASVPPGGRVRIDLSSNELEFLVVGGVEVPGADASLVRSGPTSVLLTLNDGGLETLGPGPHPLAVRVGGMWSPHGTLAIAAPDAPVLSAPPVLRHDPSANLALTGANLGGAAEALVWPDRGVSSPSDVHHVAVGSVSAGSVTVLSAGSPEGLSDVDFGAGSWRLALRIGAHVFTPYVVLEFGT